MAHKSNTCIRCKKNKVKPPLKVCKGCAKKRGRNRSSTRGSYRIRQGGGFAVHSIPSGEPCPECGCVLVDGGRRCSFCGWDDYEE